MQTMTPFSKLPASLRSGDLAVSRRDFLTRSGYGLGALALGELLGAAPMARGLAAIADLPMPPARVAGRGCLISPPRPSASSFCS